MPVKRRQQRLLIKNATILSVDAQLGDFARGDILIDGERIVALGARVDAPDALTLEARGMIALPGLVDCHRHGWQGGLRMLMPNVATLDDYLDTVHFSLAPHFRPQDIYTGCYVTAITCLDAGITTIIDAGDNGRSAAHTEAALDAYAAAGLRVLFMPGRPLAGPRRPDWPHQLERLAAQRFASPRQLLTLGLYAQPDPASWAVARRLGLPILSELLGVMAPLMAGWRGHCALGPDNILHHCTSLPQYGWSMLRDAGVRVTVAARADAQYALEGGVSAWQQALAHGFAPGLGSDTEAAYGGNMFNEMRVAFFLQRALAQAARHRGAAHAPAPVSVERILRAATLDGARCAGLADDTGSLTPGKQADLILLDGGALNLLAVRHSAGAVLHAAEAGNVDTVIVAGRLRKRGGKLLQVDQRKLRRELDASLQHVFAAAGAAAGPAQDPAGAARD
jgi:cytosine/adenosine deaminase-related metal-dependent hydrolase